LFGELPKLFDRNFATAFFLPSALFLSASLYLGDVVGLFPGLLGLVQSNLLVGTTMIGLLAWFFGVALLVLNREIIRLMEGYGRYNPAKITLGFQKRRYARIKAELEEIDDLRAKLPHGTELPLERAYRRMDLMLELADRFPDDEGWVLPTSFGNTIRAFEVYSRVMYGFEAIKGWERLLAVVPKDYRQLIDDAKAQTDFWVNLGFLSLVFILEYAGMSIFSRQIALFWSPLLALGIVVVAYNRARNAAAEWGEMVKAAFDVFLPELREKMGLGDPAGPEGERAMWTRFSQAILYRLPDLAPNEPGRKGYPPEVEQSEIGSGEASNNSPT
jgi:hypothetical protein